MLNSTRYLVVTLIAMIGVIALGLQVRSSEAGDERTYVGQETCLTSGCHAGAYHDSSDYQGAAAFRETMHQKIHQRPSPESVVIDNYFEGDSVVKEIIPTRYAPIPGQDTLLVYFSKSADRKDYYIQMKISEQPDSTPKMKVAYTYGGNGWIQRFLLEINGSHYIVPFQYVLPGYRQRTPVGGTFWFLDWNYWLTIDSTTSEARFLTFNSNRFREVSWDKNCASCHVNGFDITRRVTNGGADTAWQATWVGVVEEDSALTDQNIKIGCESCHGPGSEHVASPSKTNIVAPGTWAMTKEATDLKLALCNQCHNRMKSTLATHRYPYDEANRRPYIPGQPLDSFIQDWWKGMNVWPDRVTSYAHHQTGQDYMRSKQYANHVYKNGCWDCHTVHTNGKDNLPYQLDRDWYSLDDGEGCMSCHGSAAPSQTPALEDLRGTTTYNGRTVNAHSMHSPEISQCVNCHYTKTASIGFLDLPTKTLYEFTDHSFKVIRPSATLSLQKTGIGMLNTCAESCHRNTRGSRNLDPSLPAAPAFGTFDRANRVGTWNDSADVILADSLWFRYQQMYARYVSAAPETGVTALGLAVSAVAPNPFRDATKITFTVARPSHIELGIFDMRGTLVRSLVGGPHAPGGYSATWDGTGELGVVLDPGAYIVRLTAGGASVSKKVVLVR
jgi:hypothetical protein